LALVLIGSKTLNWSLGLEQSSVSMKYLRQLFHAYPNIAAEGPTPDPTVD